MKIRTDSFQFKLWMFFVLFTAMIFIVLWLLQTVFLQSFYNDMLIRNTRYAADSIAAGSQNDDIDDTIDELTRDNSILVIITDNNANILYSADEFKRLRKGFIRNDTDSTQQNNRMNDFPERHREAYRNLPDGYDSFLELLSASVDGTAEYRTDSMYIYGSYIDYYGSDEKAVLYVSTTLDAVGASVTIIRMQLLWVTILSLIIGFVLSWFIARKFSTPLADITEKAKKLGEPDYSSESLAKPFCREMNVLNKTLDRTNIKLNESRDFQMELLANVSHDLRTPMTMIKGYAEMIRDISWEDEKQCSEDIAVIIKEADRLNALVNEILEYSELKTENKSDELVRVDLSGIVKRTAGSFAALHKGDDTVVEINVRDGIFIYGNSSRLERALYNLMDNAVRHTGKSRRICVSLSSDGVSARVSVRDFGNGIPENELAHIWERYYTSRQRNGHGVSGLGLAIVKQISDMHGGRCFVQSDEGKGSTFSIEFDIAADNDKTD